MVEEAVELFVRMENWDGLAVIFMQLPSGRLTFLVSCFQDLSPLSTTLTGDEVAMVLRLMI